MSFCWGQKRFSLRFLSFKLRNNQTQSHKHQTNQFFVQFSGEKALHSSAASVSVSSTTRTLLLAINYFVVHSATVTECATSADCHLIVTLEILAMCPFIFRPAKHLLIVTFSVVLLYVFTFSTDLSTFLVCDSIFTRFSAFSIYFVPSFDLCASTRCDVNHTTIKSEQSKRLAVERERERKKTK